jgi:hypothetical protein
MVQNTVDEGGPLSISIPRRKDLRRHTSTEVIGRLLGILLRSAFTKAYRSHKIWAAGTAACLEIGRLSSLRADSTEFLEAPSPSEVIGSFSPY